LQPTAIGRYWDCQRGGGGVQSPLTPAKKLAGKGFEGIQDSPKTVGWRAHHSSPQGEPFFLGGGKLLPKVSAPEQKNNNSFLIAKPWSIPQGTRGKCHLVFGIKRKSDLGAEQRSTVTSIKQPEIGVSIRGRGSTVRFTRGFLAERQNQNDGSLDEAPGLSVVGGEVGCCEALNLKWVSRTAQRPWGKLMGGEMGIETAHRQRVPAPSPTPPPPKPKKNPTDHPDRCLARYVQKVSGQVTYIGRWAGGVRYLAGRREKTTRFAGRAEGWSEKKRGKRKKKASHCVETGVGKHLIPKRQRKNTDQGSSKQPFVKPGPDTQPPRARHQAWKKSLIPGRGFGKPLN